MQTEEILERLECVSGDYPQYMARCPAHNDNRPSLSLRDLKDKTLINCFAGCEAKDIMNAIGLELKDLYKN
ncbi:MAG: hypothetical protein IJH39_01830 [Clostridia bacterium]|nr:hypothetical protein [Clostridia bacterium]